MERERSQERKNERKESRKDVWVKEMAGGWREEIVEQCHLVAISGIARNRWVSSVSVKGLDPEDAEETV